MKELICNIWSYVLPAALSLITGMAIALYRHSLKLESEADANRYEWTPLGRSEHDENCFDNKTGRDIGKIFSNVGSYSAELYIFDKSGQKIDTRKWKIKGSKSQVRKAFIKEYENNEKAK